MPRTPSIKVTSEREFTAKIPELRALLVKHFRRFGNDQSPLIAARWAFHLTSASNDWRGPRYEFTVNPVVGRMTWEDDGYHKYLAATYRAPRGALEEIPEHREMVYRGMAWEEWQYIRKHCLVKSFGHYNLNQPDLTFFGNARAATYYASGFAPLAFKPSIRRPSVVIAVPRRLVLSHRDDPKKIPEDEFAVRGGLPAQAIREVWYVTPTWTEQGQFKFVTDERGRLEFDSDRDPSQQYVVAPASDATLRRACGPRGA